LKDKHIITVNKNSTYTR